MKHATLGVGLAGKRRIGQERSEITVDLNVKAVGIGHGVLGRQLGRTVVGRHDGRQGVLQGLPGLRTQHGRVGALPPVELHVVGQQALGQRRRCTREIAPVVIVADAVEVEAQAQAPDIGCVKRTPLRLEGERILLGLPA